MINKIFTLLILICFANVSIAQKHVCGVSHDDQVNMTKFIEHLNKTPMSSPRSSDPIYVPIKIHMTATNDGSGRIKANGVFNQLSVLLKDFEKVGMKLYLQDAVPNYINNTSIYENPGTFNNTIVSQKDSDALNIFICENANPANAPQTGVVLGYYSPQGDYIVMRNQSVVEAGTTLSHELGHLFSLPHTFLGWEFVYDFYGWSNAQGNPTPWDVSQFDGMYTSNTAPVTNAPVELMDQSNCFVSGDFICDTPPDYNFGFGAGGCSWANNLKDKNGDIIDPQENNFMSYFDCEEAVFSEGQKNVMIANYESNERDYVRSDYIADTTEITSNHELINPGQSEQLEYYTNILLDWTPAEGASHYLLTINSGTGDFFEYYVDETAFLIDELEPNTFYFWEVRPYNEGYFDTETKNSFFNTGSELNTSVAESNLIKDVTVFPNPTRKGQEINVSVSMKESMTVKSSIIDLTGKVVNSKSQVFQQGKNMVRLESILETGIYILKMDTEDGSIHKKIIVQ